MAAYREPSKAVRYYLVHVKDRRSAVAIRGSLAAGDIYYGNSPCLTISAESSARGSGRE